ncbi:MAG: hypothetical protein Q4P33_05910 [Flaviflexus sp.]|nr:hypothetical protein [Flaviflexus sp.]
MTSPGKASAITHPWHRRIVIICAAVTLGLILLAIAAITLIATGQLRLGDLSPRAHNLIALAIAVVIILPGFLMFVRTAASAKPRGEGALATAEQFPEIAELAADFASLVGFDRTPTVVVAGGSRPLSTSHSRFGTHIIVLHTDLLEAPRPGGGELAALRFALAREIGQLASGERSYVRQFLTMIARTTPYFSRVISRAEELTADRWGALLAPDAAADYFAHLAVGKSLWVDANIHEIAAAGGHGGVSETITSWFMESPPLPWRVLALAPFGVFSARSLAKLIPHSNRVPSRELLAKREAVMNMSSTYGSFWRRPEPTPARVLDARCDNLSVAQFLANISPLRRHRPSSPPVPRHPHGRTQN